MVVIMVRTAEALPLVSGPVTLAVTKTPEGAMTETPIQLKKILAAKAPDLPMQADDILFVPTNTAKLAAGRAAEAAIALATGLTIVAAHP